MAHLLDRLHTRYPVWNAGMGGGIASPEMVAAVNAGGGFGVLGTGAMPRDAVTATIERTRELTSRPFGANIILPMSDGGDVEACFDARVDVLVLFWGDPQPYIADAHRRDIAVVVQCGGAEDASAAADAGADAVIVQGLEAGGHNKADTPLADSLRATAAVLGRTPIIAAGGITDGMGINSALAAGAGAVSLGTRFLASHEAAASAAYKARLLPARREDTVLTDLFDLGWPNANHRVLRNQAFDTWDAAGRPASGERPGEGEEVAVVTHPGGRTSLPRYTVMPAVTGFEGDLEAVPLYAGESVDGIDSLLGCAEIMAKLAAELRAASR